MNRTMAPGHFGSHSPKYVFGRENLDYNPTAASEMGAYGHGDALGDFASSSHDFEHMVNTLHGSFENNDVINHGEPPFDRVLMDDDPKNPDHPGIDAEGFYSMQQLADEALDSGDKDSLLSAFATVSQNPHLRSLNEDFQKSYANGKMYSDQFSDLNKQFRIADEKDDWSKVSDLDHYEVAQHIKEEAENQGLIKQKLNPWRTLQAELADNLSPHFSDMVTPFDGDHIGDMTSQGHFPTGSREWLEARQNGMGASDVGQLANKNEWWRKNVNRVWDSKVYPISDKEVEKQLANQNQDYDTPLGQGNAWEDMVGIIYGAKNPDEKLIHTKDTWSDPNSNVQVNYDYLTCSDGSGIPDGVLEIKTSSKPQDWGKEEDGLDGVPKNYRAQVLTQAYCGGFDKGAVAVMINGTDFRSYKFNMDEGLKEEAEKYVKQADEFFNEAQAEKATGNPRKNPTITDYTPRPSSQFPKSMYKKGQKASRRSIFAEVSKLSGVSRKEVAEKFDSEMDKKSWDNPDDVTETLAGLYKQFPPQGKIIGIDLETNGTKAGENQIIEVGTSVADMDSGKEVSSVSQRYSVDPRHAASKGGYNRAYGASYIHHITHNDVKDQPSFNEDQAKYILDGIKYHGGRVAAHNASFEKGFLRASIPGFAKAEKEGDIRFIDTMNVCKHTMPETENNKLESFAEGNGVPYKNAHHAYDDASMMMNALYNWKDKLFKST